MTSKRKIWLKWILSLLLTLLIGVIFRLFVVDIFTVKDNDSSPILLSGDRVWIDKSAYGAILPLAEIRMSGYSSVQLGDMVVFELPSKAFKKSSSRPVKSIGIIAGMPGQKVRYPLDEAKNHLMITTPKADMLIPLNEETVSIYRQLIYFQENKEILQKDSLWYVSGIKSFGYTFAQDYYWIIPVSKDLDTAMDRPIGWIPLSRIVGRVSCVAYSFRWETFFQSDRFFQPLH